MRRKGGMVITLIQRLGWLGSGIVTEEIRQSTPAAKDPLEAPSRLGAG